jgi:molybdopterin-guanine dinucleotide biosynthesis protein B
MIENTQDISVPPIVSFIGRSNSGKTTLIEKLIPEFISRGYKIGIIKHSGHPFDVDTEGKDTWRYRKAGADAVIAAAPGEITLIRNHSCQTPEALALYCQGMDLVIVEGFKQGRQPKIEVYRKVQPEGPLFNEHIPIMAIVTDATPDELSQKSLHAPLPPEFPLFTPKDIKKIVAFIENRFLHIDY